MNILFLSSWFPLPANNGSKLRALHLLNSLTKKHRVSLLSFVDGAEAGPDLRGMGEMCDVLGVEPVIHFNPRGLKALSAFASPLPRSQIDTFSREMDQRVRSALAKTKFDVVVASELRCAEYALRAGRVPAVLDEIQVGVFRDAVLAGKVRPRLTWLKMQRYVRRLAGRFWALTTASQVELAHLKQIAPRAKNVHLIPNGVDTNALRPAQHPSADKTIIYNGALTFGANLDAMQFFISQVWPLVKAHAPDAKLKITGSHAGVDVAFCRMPDVELTGYVDDIAAHVRSARVCVVPLRVGGGTRLKILEAMALGVPVVATPKGAEGLNARHDEHILLAGNPADFARNVLDVLNDDELCRRITSQARKLVEQTYDWASIGADFARLVESAKMSV